MLSFSYTMLIFILSSLFQASHTHDAITEAAQLMKEAVDDIMVTLNEAASEVGMVGGMVDSIAEAMSKVRREVKSTLFSWHLKQIHNVGFWRSYC